MLLRGVLVRRPSARALGLTLCVMGGAGGAAVLGVKALHLRGDADGRAVMASSPGVTATSSLAPTKLTRSNYAASRVDGDGGVSASWSNVLSAGTAPPPASEDEKALARRERQRQEALQRFIWEKQQQLQEQQLLLEQQFEEELEAQKDKLRHLVLSRIVAVEVAEPLPRPTTSTMIRDPNAWKTGGGTHGSPIWTLRVTFDDYLWEGSYAFDDEGTFRDVKTETVFVKRDPILKMHFDRLLLKLQAEYPLIFEYEKNLPLSYCFDELANMNSRFRSVQEFAQKFALKGLERVEDNPIPGLQRQEIDEWASSDLLVELGARASSQVTTDWPKDDRKVLVILLGADLKPGMWSRSVLMTKQGGLYKGTARRYIEMATDKKKHPDFASQYAGVVVFSPNEDRNIQLGSISVSRKPKLFRHDGQIQYVRNAFKELVLPLQRRVDVVAHSNGGRLLVGALLEEDSATKTKSKPQDLHLLRLVNKIAMTDSYHLFSNTLKSYMVPGSSVSNLLATNARNWVPSNKPLGTKLVWMEDGVPKGDGYKTMGRPVSAGKAAPLMCVSAESVDDDAVIAHALTNHDALLAIFPYLNNEADAEALEVEAADPAIMQPRQTQSLLDGRQSSDCLVAGASRPKQRPFIGLKSGFLKSKQSSKASKKEAEDGSSAPH